MSADIRRFGIERTRTLIPGAGAIAGATEQAHTDDKQTKNYADHSAGQINCRELNIRAGQVGSESKNAANTVMRWIRMTVNIREVAENSSRVNRSTLYDNMHHRLQGGDRSVSNSKS